MKISFRKSLVVTTVGVLCLPIVSLLLILATVTVLDRSNGAVRSSGEKREYLVHVPRDLAGGTPMPLVISLHGAALWPALQERISGWSELADDHGFMVVYPAGSGRPKIWRASPEVVERDIQFVSDLIDTLTAAYPIDRDRIYVNGLSNGGAMTFALSCGLSDRIAAVGTVAAAHSLPQSWCADPPAVPLISFHGTSDPVVPYEGGTSWASPDPFPGVVEWTVSWADRNGCGPSVVEERISEDVMRLEYVDCPDAPVVLYSVKGGGHSWPGGTPLPSWLAGRTTQSIDATREMWEFFMEHPLSRDQTREAL